MVACAAEHLQTTDAATTASQSTPVTPPPAANKNPESAGSPADARSTQFETPDAMLSALEKSGEAMTTFRANVVYDRVDAVSENRERRTGEIVLEQQAGKLKSRRLAIQFDQLIDASGHATSQRMRYVFSGGWLFEFDDQRHQLIARELVPPGEQLDPLRMDEGLIPIPIGQKKDQIDQRFHVQFAAQPTEPLLKRLENVQGLALHPKPNSGVDPELGDLCVWYDLTTLAPVAVTATTKGGDAKILLLTKIQVNKVLDESAKAMLATQPADLTTNGVPWRKDVRPYKSAP